MTLENKVQSRRGFLGTALAGLTGYLTATNSYAGEKEGNKLPSLPSKTLPEYKFKDFIESYGRENWDSLSKEIQEKTKTVWNKSDDEYKVRVVEAYSKSREVYKELLENNEDFRADFRDWKGYDELIKFGLPRKAAELKKRALRKEYPWATNIPEGKMNLPEKLLFFQYREPETESKELYQIMREAGYKGFDTN